MEQQHGANDCTCTALSQHFHCFIVYLEATLNPPLLIPHLIDRLDAFFGGKADLMLRR